MRRVHSFFLVQRHGRQEARFVDTSFFSAHCGTHTHSDTYTYTGTHVSHTARGSSPTPCAHAARLFLFALWVLASHSPSLSPSQMGRGRKHRTKLVFGNSDISSRGDLYLSLIQSTPSFIIFLCRFFTAAGGVCHSLVRRPWCRWFILNKLLFRKKQTQRPHFPSIRGAARPLPGPPAHAPSRAPGPPGGQPTAPGVPCGLNPVVNSKALQYQVNWDRQAGRKEDTSLPRQPGGEITAELAPRRPSRTQARSTQLRGSTTP